MTSRACVSRNPVSAKSGAGNTRNTPDKATVKLAALHFYQLSMPAPKAPAGSYDKAAFERGKTLFNGIAKCATCHVPPLYTEPGYNLHAPSEIGIDAFQADRSPTRGDPQRGALDRSKKRSGRHAARSRRDGITARLSCSFNFLTLWARERILRIITGDAPSELMAQRQAAERPSSTDPIDG